MQAQESSSKLELEAPVALPAILSAGNSASALSQVPTSAALEQLMKLEAVLDQENIRFGFAHLSDEYNYCLNLNNNLFQWKRICGRVEGLAWL